MDFADDMKELTGEEAQAVFKHEERAQSAYNLCRFARFFRAYVLIGVKLG